jgi:hypothetical protein
MADMEAGIGPFLGVLRQSRGWNTGAIGGVITLGAGSRSNSSATTNYSREPVQVTCRPDNNYASGKSLHHTRGRPALLLLYVTLASGSTSPVI